MARSNGLRAKVVNGAGKRHDVYTPEGKTRHTITVFTDIDCPYCSKLHPEMDRYLRAGIKVRYLAYSRSGLAGGVPTARRSMSGALRIARRR